MHCGGIWNLGQKLMIVVQLHHFSPRKKCDIHIQSEIKLANAGCEAVTIFLCSTGRWQKNNNRGFNVAFTRFCNNPYPESNQSNFSHWNILTSILINSYHLPLPRGLFPIDLPFKIFKMHFSYISYLDQSSKFIHPNYTRWMVQI